ncbi:TAXI family TRAP transporter solute-binding subunit [Methylobacterium sp. ID0610]|uniref:TAXI family TRAP transporter solute-binding subunit n=1 Tax=Methylobacterium carpenticola TaxID=3344827 RepID=UPI0036BFAB6B
MTGIRFGREMVFLVVAVLLAGAAALASYFTRATTLTIAVAPSGGTEPALIRAYADGLAGEHKGLRLRILPFDGVRESAAALQEGRADLAVVRPDILLPSNGLTLAILREQAMIIAAPEPTPIKGVPDLARKRLAFLTERTTDQAVLQRVLGHYGLAVANGPVSGPLPARSVALVPLEEQDLASAFAEKRVDALAMLTTPTTSAATRIMRILQNAGRTGKLRFVEVEESGAIIERFPRLQAVSVGEGLFGGNPKTPAEAVSTVGTSYRLMARSSLSRPIAAEVTQHLFEMRGLIAETVPAANAIAAPAYDTNAQATSARLPIHPGAIDYYEREQQSLIERYETWIYLLAFLGGGIGSGLAWLRQRLSRLRRERVEVAIRRLIHIRSEARRTADRAALEEMAAEIDDLAGNIARYALSRPTEARTMAAATIAIDAARSTVRRALASGGPPKPTLRAVE